MYIGDYLGRRAIYSPDKVAIVDAGKAPAWRLSYAQLNERANKLAHWLRHAAAIQPGDRVAILARDGVEHLDCFFACGKLGAIHTALNWRLHWQELAGILATTTPRVLIYSDDFRKAVEQIRTHGLWPVSSPSHDEHGQARTERSRSETGSINPLPGAAALTHFLHLDGPGVPGSLPFEATLQASANTPIVNEQVQAEDVVALIFTGGTTGLPKGAQVTHRMIAWNSLNTIIHDLHHDDTYLNVFPLFHTGGLFVYTLPNVILGGTTILVRQFDPVQVLNLIEQEQVTVFAGVPTMYQTLTTASNWPTANLSSLRFCTSGGAPLPVPLVEQYTHEKNIRFKQGFGMTEFGPGIFALAPEDAIRKAGSIGRPNFYVDARIVDADNQPLGPDQVGELVLKGPSLSSGYFNNPSASAEAIDAEGWFHTGDLARHDEGWYFTIVDRKKDMFISGGENVYPAEIEAVLYQHPAVQMCAVIGLPDVKWGEVGLACVVLKKNAAATPDELLSHLQTRLARYKVPRQVVILESLPISAAGKILKRELRDQFTD
ncbi:MAG: long-chain fatty acid--CoA ligase [Chloroflexi bacterium]|nr:long-chain fatty acid--CoA ligase [Chloroflexota bacterium]MBP8055013.1 long-chain fatty acid--CoA ligase [Chloroflexota bacterium]